jgi:hypothetical protein
MDELCWKERCVSRLLERTGKLAGAVAAALLVLAATPAAGQALSATVYAPGDGTPNSLTFTIPVTASIGGICGFATAPSGTFDAGAIDTDTWTHDFPFKLNCTVPSRVAVVSTNGGLLNPAAPGAPGYTNKAPYTVALFLQGGTTTASANCQAETLAASAGSPCSFRGASSATQGLRLDDTSINLVDPSYLRVNAPAYAGADALISGAYADTLTVTVSASP